MGRTGARSEEGINPSGSSPRQALLRLRPSLGPYHGRIVFIVVTAFISSACGLSVPLVAKAVIDGPIAQADRSGILPYAALAIGLAAVETGFARFRRIYLAQMATGVETELRDRLYAHLNSLDVGFHDQWQSGQLLSRATADINIIRRFTGFGAIFLVIIAVQVVGILGLMASLYLPLALVVAAFAIPVIWLCARFERDYFAVVRRIQDQTGDLTTEIEEAAQGIRVIKAFGRSRYSSKRLEVKIRALYNSQLERISMHTRFVWLLGVVPNLMLTAVLLGGALAVGNGDLTLGGLVAFVSYVLILVFPMEALGWILAMANEAMTAAQRVFEVLDTEPVITDEPGATPVAVATGAIRFENVHFAFPDEDDPSSLGTEVLRGVDLHIAAGEKVALVGMTGSGKTTLAMLIARLHDPTEGRITLDGRDLRSLPVANLRSFVGVAFEEATLFSASVRENLRIGHPDATDVDIAEALAVAQAEFAYDLPWGLNTRIGEQGMTLSGGQRQRLALARAIIRKPQVLLLDDPLSALDVHTESLVEKDLRRILHNRTALIVVHRASTVALADRAALLDGGRIVATGDHHHLLESQPRYREILGGGGDRISREVMPA